MATELFHTLYHQAFRLDCPLITLFNKLKSGLGTSGKTLERVEMAKSFYNAGADFLDALDTMARDQLRVGNTDTLFYRNAVRKYRCPNCGSPYCDNAVEVVRVRPGIHISIISPDDGTVVPHGDEE